MSEQKASEQSDRREHQRQPIELKVEYRRLNSFFADFTRNISKGGTFIRTKKPLDVGTEFVFKLYVPHLEGALSLRGRVKWVVPAADAGGRSRTKSPGMGIRFIYTDDDERRGIEQIVERLMVDSLGQALAAKLMGRGPSEGEDVDE